MEDIDKKVQNMELIIAMRVLQQENTPENRNRMLNEMMKSKFITPASIDEKEEEKMRENQKKGEKTPVQVSFKVVTTKDGKRFLPAFTDTMQLNEWKEKCGITEKFKNMIMNFDVYAQYVLNSGGNLAGYIINPFGENLVFPAEIIRSLAMQRAQHMARLASKRGVKPAEPREGIKPLNPQEGSNEQ